MRTDREANKHQLCVPGFTVVSCNIILTDVTVAGEILIQPCPNVPSDGFFRKSRNKLITTETVYLLQCFSEPLQAGRDLTSPDPGGEFPTGPP